MDFTIQQVDKKMIGKKVEMQAIVEGVAQTGGPTLFTTTDGTGTLVLKGFEGAGVRAYPQIDEGDAVEALVELREYQGAFEGEIIKMKKLSPDQQKKLHEHIIKVQRARANVEAIPFMAKSPILEKLQDRFVKAASEIRYAVMNNRPIIVRHHNDADGYSSGYALERAILPLVEKQHGTGKSLWQFFSRAPSMTPYYEIEDSIKDSSKALSGYAKFSEKIPLVLIVDNGSGPESLLSIKQGKVHGIDFIIVDHHPADEDVITSEVMVHINPWLVGEEGSKISAGMLCTELARFISKGHLDNIEHIPALSGLADRINNPELMDQYFAIAQKKGYTKELLSKIASVIDFVSTKLRFMEAREYVSVVFGERMEQQKALVEVMSPHLDKLKVKALAIAKALVKKEKQGKATLQMLDIETSFSRNSYPKPGMTIGMLHDDELKQDPEKSLVSIATLSDVIVLRASEGSNFSVNEFIKHLDKNCPEAFIEGGGHKNAGAIKFVPSKQKEVLELLRSYLQKL
jgi:archaea-specific RecJ-like exonuclease